MKVLRKCYENVVVIRGDYVIVIIAIIIIISLDVLYIILTILIWLQGEGEAMVI